MKVIGIGGGPAGLYAAILVKLSDARHEVTVYERDAREVVRGWGVTFWDDLIAEMRGQDPASAEAVAAAAARWTGLELHLPGQPPVLTPEFWGHSIARSELTSVLTRRAEELGVQICYEREVAASEVATEADLVLSADGVGSRFRQAHAAALGTDVELGRNRFAWLATPRVFSAFRYVFADTPAGWLCAYAYAYSDRASTFVVEMPPATFDGLGLGGLGAEQTLAVLQEAFAAQLAGEPLRAQLTAAGTVPWQSFPTVRNRSWHLGNVALLGDAAHTTHYSIGFGTKLALEDAIALAEAVRAEPEVPAALRRYGSARRRALRGAQRDADFSRRWFERADRYLGYPAEDVASLLDRRRSGLVARLPVGALVTGRRLLRRTGVAERLRALRTGPRT